jgi:rhamnogalacturonan endolyase
MVCWSTVLLLIAALNGSAQRGVFMEKLDRGLVVLPKNSAPRYSVYVGWRLLASDPPDVCFNVYRAEKPRGPYRRLNQAPIADSTNFLDTTAEPGRQYSYKISAVIQNKERGFTKPVTIDPSRCGDSFIRIPLKEKVVCQKVAVADLDGDGAYDYVVKYPNFNTDPYQAPGYWKRSEDTYKIEAYRSDGTFLWRYDMGWAIEEGIWYSPIVVFDLDGDGRAEVYTKAGEGDPRDPDGRVTSGPEYLIELDGLTGKVRHRVDWPSRDGFKEYNYYCRNLLGIAYLDGKRPYLIVVRGTYGLMKVVAYGAGLQPLWRWESTGPYEKYGGQGMHGLHAADIDGDGCDEVILGGSVLDHDGKPLWQLGHGHPDVCYVADVDPSNPGFEIFYGFEPRHPKGGAICLVDARSGKVLWSCPDPTKHVHGQGLVAKLDASRPGLQCYAAEQDGSKSWLFDVKGNLISGQNLGGCSPKAAYWNEDALRELIIGKHISTYGGPSIQELEGNIIGIADCLGDWREEIITSVEGELRIYTTTIPARTRRVCLMQDRLYRNDVAVQSMGYFYIPQLSH